MRCEGRTFIAGADITEFGKPPQAPTLAATQFQQTLNPDNRALAPLLERLASDGRSLKDAS